LTPEAPWLAAVERRIKDSIAVSETTDEDGTTTISEEVAGAALRFFQSSADVLPSEPFLYASLRGSLVAEFTSANGSITAVISPDDTKLMAAQNRHPNDTQEITLRRGSNRVREDLRSIISFLARSHGTVVAAR
jgi:hypothetical protein